MKRLIVYLQPLLVAVQFLTVLPLRVADADYPRALRQSLLYYPLVGVLLGALLATVAWLGSDVATNLLAAIVLTLWVLLTGALHLDGLADTADAWVGGHGDRERTLAIMKDAASGPVAVSAVVLCLLWKYAGLGVLLAGSQWLLIVMLPVFARLAVMAAIVSVPYVRAGGLGSTLASATPAWQVWLTLVASLLVLFALAPLPVLAASVVTTALTLLFIVFAKRRLGGMTGDVYGALIEIVEAAVILAFVLFI